MKARAALALLVLCALIMGCRKDTSKPAGKEADAGKNVVDPSGRCPAGMALIPGGEFTMGCPDTNMGTCFDDEKPAKAVRIDDFCLDVKEVTQKQYKNAGNAAPSFFGNCGDDCPVEQVSWAEASDYCRAAGGRLPTEAEWERAARAGSDARFPWRQAPVAEYAWFAENSGGATHPVGQKKSSEYGLFDMAGNVAEWTHDCYDPVWYVRMPQDNPVHEAPSCALHTVRGGSWMTRTEHAAVSDRSGFSSDIKTNFIGFRCAANAK